MEATTVEAAYEILRAHPDYEICVEYPHQIRRISNHHIVSEHSIATGHVRVHLNRIMYRKDRLILEQWIENDDPTNKVFVDHINFDNTDNHIDNLRWLTPEQQRQNWALRNGITLTNALPEHSVPIDSYQDVEYQGYYISPAGDIWVDDAAAWFDDEEHYRKLTPTSRSQVHLYDRTGTRRCLSIRGLRREFL